MKTKSIFKKSGFILVFLFFVALPQISTAQNAPFTINNNTGCRVVVHWQLQDPINCLGCDGGTIVILPGGWYTILSYAGTCPSPILGCEMIISILDIGGTPVFFQFSSTTTTPVPYGPPVGGCTSPLANTLYWPAAGPSNFDINP